LIASIVSTAERSEVPGDAAVVGGGDDGDPGALRLAGEGVEDRFGVELFAGGVDRALSGF
jgi:hypothetical protein